MKFKELTDKIIGCAYTVYNGMGFGFLESVYEKFNRKSLLRLNMIVRQSVILLRIFL